MRYKTENNGLLSMPPNSQPANPTHGGTAASQPFAAIQKNHKTECMEKKDLYQLTDEELLVEKKKLKKSKLFFAASIGFLAGILIFGFVSWSLTSEKRFGFLIPMLIPVVFIYRLLKTPNKNKDLEEVLKERKLN
jgi:hypothetical protein